MEEKQDQEEKRNKQDKNPREECLTLGCIILAAGFSRRLGDGRNKLIEPLAGKKLIEYPLDAVLKAVEVSRRGLQRGTQTCNNCEYQHVQHRIARPLVVTRWPEVAKICEARGVKVVLHNDPDQSDSIRHGLAAAERDVVEKRATKWDGCMFITGDQPLLTAESILMLAECFRNHPDQVCRLGAEGTVGNPVVFPEAFFEDLKKIQGDRGGGAILREKGILPTIVEAGDPYELWDVDTQEDLERCEAMYRDYSTR